MAKNYDLKIDYASLMKRDFVRDFLKEVPTWISSLEDEKIFLARLIALFLVKYDLTEKTYIEGEAKICLVFNSAYFSVFKNSLRLSNNLNSLLTDYIFKIFEETDKSIKILENLILTNQTGDRDECF